MRTPSLLALGDALGLGAAPSGMAELLRDPADPFELGFAVAVGAEGRGVMLSYNPRRRGGGARTRMLRALGAVGLPVEPARVAMAWMPERRVSTVLGVEWRAGAVEATLYFEELSAGWDASGVRRQTVRLAHALDLPPPDWGDDPGSPYILAMDLSTAGLSALKTYRWTAQPPPALRTLFGCGEAAAGWILQRRHRCGVPASADPAPPLKVYKTFAYEAGGGGPAAAAELWALRLATRQDDAWGGLAGLMAGVPLTSLGLRLGETGEVGSVTGYWCLERGAGATLR